MLLEFQKLQLNEFLNISTRENLNSSEEFLSEND